MKALLNNTYIEFCSILNSFLEKVERNNKDIKKMQKDLSSSPKKKGR